MAIIRIDYRELVGASFAERLQSVHTILLLPGACFDIQTRTNANDPR